MNEQFTPRTVVLVAIASLVTGFVVVFGAGMLASRPTLSVAAPTAASPTADAGTAAPPPAPSAVADGSAVGAPVPLVEGGDAGETGDPGAAVPSLVTGDGDGGAGVSVGGITLAPSATSRCFDQASTVVIPGAHCDQLAALDQHFQAHAAQIAACAHGRGHLAFIMDFRFSTSFVRAWGGPTSNVPGAGLVAACVRRVTAPLPLAQVTHAHDRYIVVYGMDW